MHSYFRAARDARSVQPVGAGVEALLSPEEEAAAMRKFGSSHLKHVDVQPTTRYASSLVRCSLWFGVHGRGGAFDSERFCRRPPPASNIF